MSAVPHHPIEVPGPTVRDFFAQLEVVPWFVNIGQPTPWDGEVERIYDWNEWPGPEEPGITVLFQDHQDLYDVIMGEAASQLGALLELWECFGAAVIRAAASTVPYDPAKDAYHGPSTAVWQARWTAGLVGLCLHTDRSIPQELLDQWLWFTRGHWPSGYASVDPGWKPGQLMVY